MRNGGINAVKNLNSEGEKISVSHEAIFQKKNQTKHTTPQQHTTTKRKPTPSTHNSRRFENPWFFWRPFFAAKAFERAFSETMPFPFFCPENYLSLSTLHLFLGQGYHVHRPFGDMQFLIPDPDSDSLRSKTSRF